MSTIKGPEATMGSYNALYAPMDGTMVVTSIQSSSYNRKASTVTIGEDELPSLQRWSDVMYLAYFRYYRDLSCNVFGLRHIFMHKVVNNDTLSIIEKAMSGSNAAILPFENRLEFSTDSDIGKALLGSPSGYCLMWMLLGHLDLRDLWSEDGVYLWHDIEFMVCGRRIW